MAARRKRVSLTDEEPVLVGNLSDRDKRGRFQTGNPGGPGRKVGPYKAALNRAATPAAISKVLKKMIGLAKIGDVAAAGLVLRYSLPMPPKEEPGEHFDLPEIKSAADLPQASEAIMTALSAGRVSPPAAHVAAVLLETWRKGFEALELERRIKALEELQELEGRKNATWDE